MLIYEPPIAVKNKVEQLRQPGENYHILPLELRLFGDNYFWVRYDLKNRFSWLIVDKNGNVPPKNKVKDVLTAGMFINSAYHDLKFNKKMAKMKHDLILKKYLSLFNELKDYITEQNPKMMDDFFQFEHLIHTCIELQPKLRNGMKRIKELGEFFHDNRYINDEIYKEFRKYHYLTAKSYFLQGYEQVKTYHARKRIISYLFRSGKVLWSTKLWLIHIRFLSDDLPAEQRKGFNDLEKIFIEGKEPEEINIIYNNCRNPEGT